MRAGLPVLGELARGEEQPGYRNRVVDYDGDGSTERLSVRGIALGVIPDIDVPLTVESIRSPEDEVLQAAEAALLAQVAN